MRWPEVGEYDGRLHRSACDDGVHPSNRGVGRPQESRQVHRADIHVGTSADVPAMVSREPWTVRAERAVDPAAIIRLPPATVPDGPRIATGRAIRIVPTWCTPGEKAISVTMGRATAAARVRAAPRAPRPTRTSLSHTSGWRRQGAKVRGAFGVVSRGCCASAAQHGKIAWASQTQTAPSAAALALMPDGTSCRSGPGPIPVAISAARPGRCRYDGHPDQTPTPIVCGPTP